MSEWRTTRRPYKFGPAKRQAYLDALRRGLRRGAAAASVGISPERICQWCKEHPEFRDEIDRAELAAIGQVEDALFQKCLAGHPACIMFYLMNRAPEEWKDRRAVNHLPTESQYSEAQLQEMLKARGLQV